jgi:hypothetical protein
MQDSIADLIGMIDSGVPAKEQLKGKKIPGKETLQKAKEQDKQKQEILEIRKDLPTRAVMSQRGIRKRPFEQAKPNFDSESSS